MNLQEIRNEIDEIDSKLSELFAKRMECSKRVAEYKLENGMSIFNPEREIQILDKVEKNTGEYGFYARRLFSEIMELSRALQHDMLYSGSDLRNDILSAEKEIPYNSKDVRIACFGVPETYSHSACRKLFPNAEPEFYPTFRELFEAMQSDKAQFGIVPIENSSAGSVTDVYDLMLKYRFYIAASTEIPVDHCLAAVKGTKPEDVKKVLSHGQALYQCSEYISSHGLEQEQCKSTAAAAKLVSESGDNTIAAICSEDAAKRYGLEIILRDFRNDPHNKTRFIVISKKLYIEDSADKISLCFALPHVTGSLYNVLCRFAVNGLNLTKIESRPKPGTEFEYLFYLDFDGTTKSDAIISLICALSNELTDFSFLGNYHYKMDS